MELPIICAITGKRYNSLRGFLNHLRTLKMTSKEYYDYFIRKDGENICVCGRETTFDNFSYKKWCDSNCQILVSIRLESVRNRYRGKDRETKISKMLEKRGVVDINVDKRRKTIEEKCKTLGISTETYYSEHGKKGARSVTKEQKEISTEKAMKTKLDNNRIGGRSYYKNYSLFNENIIVQGYEPIILDYLQQVLLKEELVVSNGKKVNHFKYNSLTGVRNYYPDLLIPNFIVEVKSDYTFSNNKEGVFNKIGGVFDSGRNILIIIPSKQEVRKGKLDGSKKLLDWAISSQASKYNSEPIVVMYDEGSTTIQIGVESSDSKNRGSGRILSEHDIVWSHLKEWVG